MAAEFERLAKRFVMNSGLTKNILDGFETSDWLYRPEAGGNTAHWLIGHLALYRRILRRKLGETFAEDGWEPYFTPRNETDHTQDYPAAIELLDDFMRSRKPLTELFASLTEEQADADWGREFPDGSTTILGGAFFLHFHETYHIGQLGYIRRLLGKPGLL